MESDLWRRQTFELVNLLVTRSNDTARILAALVNTTLLVRDATNRVLDKTKAIDLITTRVAVSQEEILNSTQRARADASSTSIELAATRAALETYTADFAAHEAATSASYTLVARTLQDVARYSEAVLRLQGMFMGNLLLAQTAAFYVAVTSALWFVTSGRRVSSARPSLLLAVAAMFVVEWYIVRRHADGHMHPAGSQGIFTPPARFSDAVTLSTRLLSAAQSLLGVGGNGSSHFTAQGSEGFAQEGGFEAIRHTVVHALRVSLSYVLAAVAWVTTLVLVATWKGLTYSVRAALAVVGLEHSTEFIDSIEGTFAEADIARWKLAETQWAIRLAFFLACGLFLLRQWATFVDYGRANHSLLTHLATDLQATLTALRGSMLGDGKLPLPFDPTHTSGLAATVLSPGSTEPFIAPRTLIRLGSGRVTSLERGNAPVAMHAMDGILAGAPPGVRIPRPATLLQLQPHGVGEWEGDEEWIPRVSEAATVAVSAVMVASPWDASGRLRARHPPTGQAMCALPPLMIVPTSATLPKPSASGGRSSGMFSSWGTSEAPISETTSRMDTSAATVPHVAYAHLNPTVAYESGPAFAELVLLQYAAGRMEREDDNALLARSETVLAPASRNGDDDEHGYADDWSVTDDSMDGTGGGGTVDEEGGDEIESGDEEEEASLSSTPVSMRPLQLQHGAGHHSAGVGQLRLDHTPIEVPGPSVRWRGKTASSRKGKGKRTRAVIDDAEETAEIKGADNFGGHGEGVEPPTHVTEQEGTHAPTGGAASPEKRAGSTGKSSKRSRYL